MTRFFLSGYNFTYQYACRGTMLIGAANLSPFKNLVAGTGAVSWYKLFGARNLSRCRILIACRYACPGTRAITNLSWVQEHLPAGRQESKKCGKPIKHTVRVMVRLYFLALIFSRWHFIVYSTRLIYFFIS